MTNYLFKSGQKPDLQIIRNQLEMLLDEQRHQRSDLRQVIKMLQTLLNNANLQKQVDEYFEEDSKDIPEVEE